MVAPRRWNFVVELRAARIDDLTIIVSMAHGMKRRLAAWSPRYFHPHVDAEARHEAWLTYLVGSADHDTRVLTDRGEVVGFFNVIRQPAHWWVDDLVLSNDSHWPDAARLLTAHVAELWVTLASRSDTQRSAALAAARLTLVSTYWAAERSVGEEDEPAQDSLDLMRPGTAPAHTFGGGPFDPRAPGALVVADGLDGYAIGSAGLVPPLYDPGGPTAVIDQIVGARRADLLDRAMARSAARGDAGIIVVCATDDHELRHLLEDRRYLPELDVFAAPHAG